MRYRDLREWLALVDELGELKRIEGCDLEYEMGGLCEAASARANPPVLLFDRIAGYPAGYRIAGIQASDRGMALTLGMPPGMKVLEMIRTLRLRVKNLAPVPPRQVEWGPVLQNVHLGEEVDLREFPVPKWHELDGGPYIGTGDLVMTRDPDEGWVNVGTYRIQLYDKNTVGFYISPGKHGRIHRDKYFARGEPCPVAICLGPDPLMMLVASMSVPWGTCEYDYAGGLRGEPVEVIPAPVTGLPIPANAEIVIEGESMPGDTMEEGPFGEFPGYYGSGSREEPLIRVKSILHRDDPILYGSPPLKPTGGASGELMKAAMVWNTLERTGLPGVEGVAHYMDNFITVVSVRQRYPGHSKQIGALASQIPGAAYAARWIIVVDDDIDPTNFDQVMWALATRCDPELSINILNRCWSTQLDPMSRPGLLENGPRVFNSRAIVDACIPFELKSRGLFPAVVGASSELRAKIEEKYGSILDS